MRLIDADKLQKEFQQKLKYCMEWKKKSTENESRADAEMAMLEECIITIDCQPLIDVAPTVRCKDCKWWDGIDGTACKHPDCRNPIHCNPDEFCDGGEKK